MCDRAINRCFLALFYISDWYKTQEICESGISEILFWEIIAWMNI